MNKETLELNKKAIKIAVNKIKKTYSRDKIIIQTVQALTEEEHGINIQYERLSDFFWRYNPEELENINSVNQLIKVIESDKPRIKETMGYDLNDDEIKLIKDYANSIKEHLKVLKILESFIKKQTMIIAPETSNIATPLLTAKLMALAGSFKRLAMLPASTIQLLGAEKALFRHLRTGAKSPKHGVILHHQSVQSAKNKGKAARQLANKISTAIKIDFFRGVNK